MNSRRSLFLLAGALSCALLAAGLALLTPDGKGRAALTTEGASSPSAPPSSLLPSDSASRPGAPGLRSKPLSPEVEALLALARRDPAAAFAEAARRYEGETLRSRICWLGARLLDEDFSRAAEILAALPDQRLMLDILAGSVPVAYKRDHLGTMATISTFSGPVKDAALRHVVRAQLDEKDFRAAMQTQLSMPESHERTLAICDVGERAAGGDLGDVLRWLEKVQGDPDRHAAHFWVRDALSEAKDDTRLAVLLTVTPADDPEQKGGSKWGRDNLIRRIAYLRRDAGNTAGLAALRDSLSDAEKKIVDVVPPR